MAGRKKRRGDGHLSAARRQQLRDELPPLVTLEDMGDLCRSLDPDLHEYGCRGETHSLSGTLNWITNTQFYNRESEILAWLGAIGGGCDCTVRAKAFPRVLRLSEDVW
jgi:hypothetical protein